MIDEDKIEETIQNRLISLSLLTTVLTRGKYLIIYFLSTYERSKTYRFGLDSIRR